ncbi:uncharacterized protein V6R79_022240 [Siganus canaliculatus]
MEKTWMEVQVRHGEGEGRLIGFVDHLSAEAASGDSARQVERTSGTGQLSILHHSLSIPPTPLDFPLREKKEKWLHDAFRRSEANPDLIPPRGPAGPPESVFLLVLVCCGVSIQAAAAAL